MQSDVGYAYRSEGGRRFGQFASSANPFTLMGGGEIGIGALVAVIGIAAANGFDSAPALWIPVVVVIGFCAGAFDLLQQTLIQMAVPNEQRGRADAARQHWGHVATAGYVYRLLDERFARGDIDEREYRARRDLLRGRP